MNVQETHCATVHHFNSDILLVRAKRGRPEGPTEPTTEPIDPTERSVMIFFLKLPIFFKHERSEQKFLHHQLTAHFARLYSFESLLLHISRIVHWGSSSSSRMLYTSFHSLDRLNKPEASSFIIPCGIVRKILKIITKVQPGSAAAEEAFYLCSSGLGRG